MLKTLRSLAQSSLEKLLKHRNAILRLICYYCLRLSFCMKPPSSINLRFETFPDE